MAEKPVCIACKKAHRGKKCPDLRPRMTNGRLPWWARKNDDLKFWEAEIARFRAESEKRRLG